MYGYSTAEVGYNTGEVVRFPRKLGINMYASEIPCAGKILDMSTQRLYLLAGYFSQLQVLVFFVTVKERGKVHVFYTFSKEKVKQLSDFSELFLIQLRI